MLSGLFATLFACICMCVCVCVSMLRAQKERTKKHIRELQLLLAKSVYRHTSQIRQNLT
jgi:preprotein translocase subunit YajC